MTGGNFLWIVPNVHSVIFAAKNLLGTKISRYQLRFKFT